MFANLLLTLVLISGKPATVGHPAAEKVATAAVAEPSCITGPIRVRLRTQGGTVQIAANAIRVEGVDHPADAMAQPDR